MNVNKININQSEESYYIASDIYDVTYHNSDITFASLSELLSSKNLSTLIPSAVRCGGMTIRFVQSSDNKYVQFRYIGTSTTTVDFTNVSNWQGVDEQPTAGSDNLVKSGGVYKQIDELKVKEKEHPNIELKKTEYFVNTTGTRGNYAGTGIFGVVPVKKGQKCIATISGTNGGMSPLAFGVSPSTDSDLLCTQLVQYHTGDNVYEAVVEEDGYCFISSSNTDTPALEIITYLEMEEFIKTQQDVTVLKEDVENIERRLTIAKQVPVSLGKEGFYVKKDGTRGEYHFMGIYGPIAVSAGDIVNVSNLQGLNSSMAPLAFSTLPTMNSDMSCTVLAPYKSEAVSYEGTALENGFVFVTSGKTDTPSVLLLHKKDLQTIQDELDDIDCRIDTIDEKVEENKRVLLRDTQMDVIIEKQSYYVNKYGTRSNFEGFSIYTPIEVKKGDVISVSGININSAVCPLAFSTSSSTNSDMSCTPMAVFSNGVTEYSAEMPNDGYAIISNATANVPSVVVSRRVDFDEIEKSGNVLAFKRIMLFGDSLTAGRSVISFGKDIADNLGVPYRRFVYDRFDPAPDTNSNDFDVSYPNVTNYAKDGTKNGETARRVDSILQRVKNHIKIDTPVDYVLVECAFNDYTSGTKGQISDSYTAEYDVNTAIGAIEETCRYLSTLGKELRFGFFIPWRGIYMPDSYFDDYIPVFEKWSVPYIDLRNKAGFDLKHCEKHQELYSLPASSYANYNATTTYNLDDKVKYNGYLYKCNTNGVVGIPPTDTTYWTKVSDGDFDGTHLNSLGHYIVAGKIQYFIESL